MDLLPLHDVTRELGRSATFEMVSLHHHSSYMLYCVIVFFNFKGSTSGNF